MFFKTGLNSSNSDASKAGRKLGKHSNLKKKLYSHFTFTDQKSLQMCLEDSVFTPLQSKFHRASHTNAVLTLNTGFNAALTQVPGLNDSRSYQKKPSQLDSRFPATKS